MLLLSYLFSLVGSIYLCSFLSSFPISFVFCDFFERSFGVGVLFCRLRFLFLMLLLFLLEKINPKHSQQRRNKIITFIQLYLSIQTKWLVGYLLISLFGLWILFISRIQRPYLTFMSIRILSHSLSQSFFSYSRMGFGKITKMRPSPFKRDSHNFGGLVFKILGDCRYQIIWISLKHLCE